MAAPRKRITDFFAVEGNADGSTRIIGKGKRPTLVRFTDMEFYNGYTIEEDCKIAVGRLNYDKKAATEDFEAFLFTDCTIKAGVQIVVDAVTRNGKRVRTTIGQGATVSSEASIHYNGQRIIEFPTVIPGETE